MKSLEEFTQRIVDIRAQRNKLNERWPNEVREGVRALCDQGISRKQISEATGLAPSLIGGWVIVNVKPKVEVEKAKPTFKQVKIVQNKKENSMKYTLRSEKGFYVEGLDLDSLTTILGKFI